MAALRIESQDFTPEETEGFLLELEERDRLALADRIEAGSARLRRLGARVPEGAVPEGEGWGAKEVLAHIAVLSLFYGVLTYQVGSGLLTELDLLGNVHLRDVLGQEAAQRPVSELLEQARFNHQRTVKFLRGTDAAGLRRRIAVGAGRSMSAGEIARLALCSHLELHLDQLERALP